MQDKKSQMGHAKFNREKKFKKVIENGQPEAMQEIEGKVKQLSTLFDKVSKIDKKLEFQQNTKEEADACLKDVRQKLADLEAKAQAKGIDYNNIDESEPEISFGLSTDPLMYERKKNIVLNSIETDKAIYSKKLADLKQKLVQAIEAQNEVVTNIRARQDQTSDKRKEVNELMVKCKLIMESDVQQEKDEGDETLKDLPVIIEPRQEELIGVINSIVKSQGKHKRKARNNRSKINNYFQIKIYNI